MLLLELLNIQFKTFNEKTNFITFTSYIADKGRTSTPGNIEVYFGNILKIFWKYSGVNFGNYH